MEISAGSVRVPCIASSHRAAAPALAKVPVWLALLALLALAVPAAPSPAPFIPRTLN